MISLAYERVTEPATLPVTLGDLKEWGVIEHNETDPLLLGLISEVTDYLQKHTRLQYVSAQFKAYFDEFSDEMEIPIHPLVSIDAVNYFDGDDVEQLLDPAAYNVRLRGRPFGICSVDGSSWPATNDKPENISITFTAGYGTESDIPRSLKLAIMMLTLQHHGNREGLSFVEGKPLPHSVNSLLQKHLHYPIL